eukprot:scaffold42364_cov69-Phaeocystis_antarctica.AAC.3
MEAIILSDSWIARRHATAAMLTLSPEARIELTNVPTRSRTPATSTLSFPSDVRLWTSSLSGYSPADGGGKGSNWRLSTGAPHLVEKGLPQHRLDRPHVISPLGVVGRIAVDTLDLQQHAKRAQDEGHGVMRDGARAASRTHPPSCTGQWLGATRGEPGARSTWSVSVRVTLSSGCGAVAGPHLPGPRIVLVQPIQLTPQRRDGRGKRSTHALDPSQRDLVATKDLRATVVAGAAHVEDLCVRQAADSDVRRNDLRHPYVGAGVCKHRRQGRRDCFPRHLGEVSAHDPHTVERRPGHFPAVLQLEGHHLELANSALRRKQLRVCPHAAVQSAHGSRLLRGERQHHSTGAGIGTVDLLHAVPERVPAAPRVGPEGGAAPGPPRAGPRHGLTLFEQLPQLAHLQRVDHMHRFHLVRLDIQRFEHPDQCLLSDERAGRAQRADERLALRGVHAQLVVAQLGVDLRTQRGHLKPGWHACVTRQLRLKPCE